MTEPKTILAEGNWLTEVKAIFAAHEPVALPTETVYGLAAPAGDAVAVARIFEIKQRPSFNPLILHVKEDWDLSPWAELGATEKKLAEKFWPGPLSLLVPKKNVSDLVTAGSPRVVVRAPQHPVFRKLLDDLGEPLVAPSANSSTRLSATTAEAVREDLAGHGLCAVVDGGRSELGIESTIVEVKNDFVIILREGALAKEDFERAGFTVVKKVSLAIVPGGQEKHYAPLIPLRLFDDVPTWLASAADVQSPSPLWVKVLASDGPDQLPGGARVFCLAPDDDLKTAAHELFEFLRDTQKKYSELRVLKTREVALGRAINDRLLRASQR